MTPKGRTPASSTAREPGSAGGAVSGTSFFGRRKGPRLRDGQAALIRELLPRLRLPEAMPGNLEELFPRAVSEVRLEIGFGGGEHLLAAAAREPEVGFIGVEPFVNGMAKMLAAIAERKLENIRLWDDDAVPLLRLLPEASLARVDLFYPDPWPKRRQRKRRFVSATTLGSVARVLADGGMFRFASDIDDYAGWTLARAAGQPELDWMARRADDWRLPYPGWVRTRYEAKAIAAGRVPSYLRFRRVPRQAS